MLAYMLETGIAAEEEEGYTGHHNQCGRKWVLMFSTLSTRQNVNVASSDNPNLAMNISG